MSHIAYENYREISIQDCVDANLNISNLLPLKSDSKTLELPNYLKRLNVEISQTCHNFLNLLDNNFGNPSIHQNYSRIITILMEVIENSGTNLKLFGPFENDWRSLNFNFIGKIDLVLGISKDPKEPIIGDDVTSVDTCLIIIYTEEWNNDKDYLVITAQLGALLKKRLELGYNTPVFGVLTDSVVFKFFYMNLQFQIFSSGLPINYQEYQEFNGIEGYIEILRWFRWMTDSILSFEYHEEGFEKALEKVSQCCLVKSEK